VDVARTTPPGPNLAAELEAAGLPSRMLWYPATDGSAGGTLVLPDIAVEDEAAAQTVIDAHHPDTTPPPPSLEERVATLEAWVAAHEGG